MIINDIGYSQTNLPILLNERGDTLQYTWPIPDSMLCNKDEIIIKFKKNGLFLNKLCYDYQDFSLPNLSIQDIEVFDTINQAKIFAMLQQFPLDSIIADNALLTTMKSFGGLYLTRITSADPCNDTLSITRYGDTIKISTYLYMKLKLDNDTSLIPACTFLTYFHQNAIDIAEPNYCYNFNRIPIDTYFHGSKIPPNDDIVSQKSLKSNQNNAVEAWGYQTGSKDIRVAVIDDGIDFFHCDLGGNYGQGYKVVSGFNYYIPKKAINFGTDHGTKVAGIIGALTDGVANGCPNSGIAGIAGGWLSDEGSPTGCSLIGLKISEKDDFISQDKIMGAIFEASSDIPNEKPGHDSAYKANIINCSWGGYNYSELLRASLNYAYEHGVSVICSRGNVNKYSPTYPSSYDPNWITSVGGHSTDPVTRWGGSNYGYNIDILAPAIWDDIITTKSGGGWTHFDMTSAAAAHVSGAIALLRSEFLDTKKYPNIKPEPEDYENLLKVVAVDLDYDEDNLDDNQKTHIGYDNVSGWGQLKIGEIFEKLSEGYKLYHYKITGPFNFSDFSDELGDIVIANEGKRKDCEQGTYKSSKQRTVSKTFEIPGQWIRDNEHKLYVWGRNGRSNKGGFSAGRSPVLYLTSYTQVTSASGGNNIVDGIIVPENSNTITAVTYQYKIKKDGKSEEILLPNSDNLELYISVFGLPNPLSIDSRDNNHITNIVFPNPVKDYLEISSVKELTLENNSEITIYNVYGEKILTSYYEFGINNRLNLSHLSSGIYFIRIGTHFEKFVKM